MLGDGVSGGWDMMLGEWKVGYDGGWVEAGVCWVMVCEWRVVYDGGWSVGEWRVGYDVGCGGWGTMLGDGGWVEDGV